MSDNVLIVDDSLTVQMDLDAAFRAAGLDTTLCKSLAEARAAVAGKAPCLVVLDVVLPDGDGVDFLRELRTSAATAALPVIMLSTEAEVADRIRGLEQGADEYVGKPYETAYVVARVAALVYPEAGRDPATPTVLVIDDSLTFREELGAQLRGAGYRALLAASGEEGLRKASDVRPDGIIVDGIMPDLGGVAVVRRIRLDPGLHTTPCLLLTATEGVAGEVEALDAGVDAYVRKTEGAEVVLARLNAMLRSARESRDRVHSATLLGPKKILAVDDSITYLEELAERLREENYEVVKAHSGEEALALLSLDPVDCILLDLQMPGLSGTETCRRIKNSALYQVPVIILTAREDRSALVDGIQAGADDYVTKSTEFDVLKARVRAQLRRKQFEDENRRVREELLRKDAEAKAARRDAEARNKLLDELERVNAELSFRAAELERLNSELKTFAYSVSHDLRQPLRGMDGFSKVLLERYGEALDEQGKHYLERIRAGSQRMGELIDGLLTLSRVSRKPLEAVSLDLADLAGSILGRLQDADPRRAVATVVQPDMRVEGDRQLLESVLENLLGNAWKFTAKLPKAKIEFAATEDDRERVFFVRDNGAGFDMRYADKLFGPFQRLHAAEEFEGTGVGLATVQRIIHRHGGRIWAEAASGEGATFFFTLEATRGEP
jgi:DNA-binding response OmpR family regulator